MLLMHFARTGGLKLFAAVGTQISASVVRLRPVNGQRSFGLGSRKNGGIGMNRDNWPLASSPGLSCALSLKNFAAEIALAGLDFALITPSAILSAVCKISRATNFG